jgi:hypothetical protein
LKHFIFRHRTFVSTLCATAILLPVSGCKSYWIAAHIENQTGQAVRELEVDYPTASFGTNLLAPGASMNYRFKIRGSGPITVGYTTPDGKTPHAEGLKLVEEQQGDLTILLLPQGKVEFQPRLKPAS